ncbi:MAG: protein kinase [Acidobacteria bacterium]|nr:protein kinase [Acidobacteriota bacterium]
MDCFNHSARKRISVWGWFLLGFLLFPPSVLGINPDKAITQYVIKTWQDELPQNSVNAIAQTADGYLWFGTYEGLVRFDGVRFTVFDRSNTPEFQSNHVWRLFVDSQNRLWIGTLGSGLYCYENGRFTHIGSADGLLNNFIRTLAEGPDHSLWIGTDGGLHRYRNGQVTGFTEAQGLKSNLVTSFWTDHSGAFWVGTDKGLNRLSSDGLRLIPFADELLSKRIFYLSEDPSGTLWAGTTDGVILIDANRTQGTRHPKLSGLRANAICRDRDGCVWFGVSGEGVFRFTEKGLSSLSTKNGLVNDRIRNIFEDREGNIWIGTGGGGVTCLSDGKFVNYTVKEGLSTDSIRAVYEGLDGAIWIGTDSGGVCRYQNGEFQTFSTQDGLPGDIGRAIVQCRDGTLWVGTSQGCAWRKDGKFTPLILPGGFECNIISALCEDRNGGLWIASFEGLFFLKDGKLSVFTTANGLQDNEIRSLYQDRQGTLWVGMYGGGIDCIRDGKITKYPLPNTSGQASSVWAFHEDQAGNLWIGTDAGLLRLRPGILNRLTTSQGLFSDTIFQILEDGRHNLWMTCNRGIFSVPKAEIEAVFTGEAASVGCTVYDKLDGLNSNQCNGGTQPAGWKTRDGKLWFPTLRGVSVIDPERISKNLKPPPVVIEQVLVDGRPVPVAETLTIPHTMEQVEFTYTGLSLIVPERIKFKYILEEYDKNWVDAGTRRTAYYTKIPPGNYRFRLIACNQDGIWNETGAVLSIRVPTPLWRTWWAICLYAIGSLGLGWGGVRFRIRTLQRQNEILESKIVQRTALIEEQKANLAQQKARLENQNQQLEQKNQELEASHQQADRIFSALAEALPGTVLDGKYRLETKIGAGGFGVVFRATHLTLNLQIAVKVFKPLHGNDSAKAVERFKREGISASRLSHPNAIRVLDSGISDEGIAYLVMEFLRGCTLAQAMRRQSRFSIQQCIEILVPICEALAEAHQLQIIHRDIKPDNIFLNQTIEGEVVKVVDFGIAKMVGDESGGEMEKLTQTGGFLGTPLYMAPERFLGQGYDGRSDVYSVGVMFYEMLNGKVPFPVGPSGIVGVMMAHFNQPPPSLRLTDPEIPEVVEALIEQTLAKDSTNRMDARELAHRLRQLAEMLPANVLNRVPGRTTQGIADTAIEEAETLGNSLIHLAETVTIGTADKSDKTTVVGKQADLETDPDG